MGIGAAIVGGAVIGGYASNKAASKSSKAAKSAANTQAAAQDRATEMQMKYLEETREDIADAVREGLLDLEDGFAMAIHENEPLTGLDEYNAAKKLLSDPEAILDRPSVRFQRGQGIEALQSAFSRTSGGGTSGPAMKAAIEYGQNFASTALDAELNRLFPFANSAITARNNIANLYQGEGIAKANLRVGGASRVGNVTGQAVPSIAAGIANQGNISAAGSINQANISSNLYSNLANTGSNLAMMYATNPGLFSWGGGNTTPTPQPTLQEQYPNIAFNMPEGG